MRHCARSALRVQAQARSAAAQRYAAINPEVEMNASAGARFRHALAQERPLQLVGAVNAYCALLAERAGFRAIYLSGAGVANASFGLPDLAMTTLTEVCEELRRLTAVSTLPLIVDADTGFGPALTIARTIREVERGGAAGCHLEDQAAAKRCGHRPRKVLVPTEEMLDRLKAATDARRDADFVVIARTDAHAVEGQSAALERAMRYAEAGADMIFAEALTSLDEYRAFCGAVSVPVLANLTEFGRTPLFTLAELRQAGVAVVLYPLTAFRAMSRAAEDVYRALRETGTQRELIDRLQTRDELYQVLGYHEYERRLDRLYGQDDSPEGQAR
jgi:methylisocitrate lyase